MLRQMFVRQLGSTSFLKFEEFSHKYSACKHSKIKYTLHGMHDKEDSKELFTY
jgi:hypothetical protein